MQLLSRFVPAFRPVGVRASLVPPPLPPPPAATRHVRAETSREQTLNQCTLIDGKYYIDVLFVQRFPNEKKIVTLFYIANFPFAVIPQVNK